MEVKLGICLLAILLIVGKLNCQPINNNDNDENLLINKNRDITLPNNNNNSDSSSNSSESKSSDNSSNSSSSSNENSKTDVPLIFPEDTKNYKILPSNVTIIKKLLHQNAEDSSEIADLNKPAASTEPIPVPALDVKIPVADKLKESRRIELSPAATMVSSSTPNPSTKNTDYYEDDYSSGEEVENYNDEVENVQAKHPKKPKIELEEQFERKADEIKSTDDLPIDLQDIDNPAPITNDEQTSNSILFIAIVVGVAFLSTTIYLGLFIWRRKLEGRYGMRERLVTDEDDVRQDDFNYRNQQHSDGRSITVREVC